MGRGKNGIRAETDRCAKTESKTEKREKDRWRGRAGENQKWSCGKRWKQGRHRKRDKEEEGNG